MAGLIAGRLPSSSTKLVTLPSARPIQPLRAAGRRTPLQVKGLSINDFLNGPDGFQQLVDGQGYCLCVKHFFSAVADAACGCEKVLTHKRLEA